MKADLFCWRAWAVAQMGWCGEFPLLSEEGWTRPSQNIAKPPLWSGRGGDAIPQTFVEVGTPPTPSARAKDAARRFLDRAATPPRKGSVVQDVALSASDYCRGAATHLSPGREP